MGRAGSGWGGCVGGVGVWWGCGGVMDMGWEWGGLG